MKRWRHRQKKINKSRTRLPPCSIQALKGINQHIKMLLASVSLEKLMRTLTSKSWTLQIWSHSALDDYFSVIVFSGIWLGEIPPPPTTSTNGGLHNYAYSNFFTLFCNGYKNCFPMSYVCSTKHCKE